MRKPHIVAALNAAGVAVILGAHPPDQIRKPASHTRHSLTLRQHREAVAAEQAASARRTNVTVDRVSTEFARVAFADLAAIVDWDGTTFTLRPRDEISPDDRAAIAELRVKPGKYGTRTTIRLHSKLAALEALAKHLGFYRAYDTNRAAAVPDPAEQRARGDAAREELRKRLLRIARGGDEPADAAPDVANESTPEETLRKAKG